MSLSREDLEQLRRRLERLRAAHTSPAGTGADAAASGQPAITMPSAWAPAAPHDQAPGPLEVLALRDRLIQAELMRLQRALSRQNFRGAESARRLVRKLARKAEQNVSELEALMRLTS